MSYSKPDVDARTGGFRLAVAVALTQTIGTALFVAGRVTVLGYALLAVGGLTLVDRFRAPRQTVILVAATSLLYLAQGCPVGLSFIAPLVAAFNGLRARTHVTVWATSLASLIAWGLLVRATAATVLPEIAALAAAAVIVEAGAAWMRAIARADTEQIRSSVERTRRQISDERLLIAAELHDVLGHHLSLINMRAAVGRRLFEHRPEEARSALDAIELASAEALREVRSMLGVLRPTRQSPPRAPMPGLPQLRELTEGAGLPVSTTIIGEPRQLPSEVERAAYRIVQEALTNVRRHAGADASVSVLIDYGRQDELMVQIDDDGGSSPRDTVISDAPHGNGITGMHERAAALGGTLSAHPLPGTGWRVHGVLPIASPQTEQPTPEDRKPGHGDAG